jgi:histidine decarboxylase
MVLSGHKFLGAPIPCGMFAMRDSDRPRPPRTATYTGSTANTWANSRSGFAALCLWYTLRRHGIDGLRTRADQSRDLASYTHRQLVEIGWPAWRHNPLGFTVVLQTPPPELTARWSLPDHGPVSHIICVPGLTKDRIDAFIDELRRAAESAGSDPAGSSQPGTDGVDGAAVSRRQLLGVRRPRSRSRHSYPQS